MPQSAPTRIDDRLMLDEGRFFLPAMQALVRLPLEQVARDRARSLRIGGFVAGYPGSPLGGYDLALQKVRKHLDARGVVHQPAGNEEQAATALMGTQMLDRYAHSRYDGVVGYWYGKGPGLDRSGDAIRHGNFAGTSEHGAVVVLSGEDHEATSSTMPHQQDHALMAAGIPILYPSSVADIRRLGLHAAEMSRFSGCWVSLKLVAALCDGGSVVSLARDDVPVLQPEVEIDGRPFVKRTDFTFFPGKNIEQEEHLFYERHVAALEYARSNGLDRVLRSAPGDRIGIITAGKSAADVQQALLDAGIDDDDLARGGIRVLQLGLIWPLDRRLVREFCAGLEQVIVVEEKRDVVEAQVKQALQEAGSAVPVVGKFARDGRRLFPLQGGFGPDVVLRELAPYFQEAVGEHRGLEGQLERVRATAQRPVLEVAPRTPNYCSGCPHSTSTVLDEGQVAWGSPGCHSFATTIEQEHRQVNTMTQLGGEGLPWIGLAPFTDQPHIVQNVGDGSLYHSAYANIPFAVDAGVDITFKILWNGFVANTGAQEAVGGRGVPELVQQLVADRVARITLVTKEPERYRGVALPDICELRGPDEVAQVSGELATVSGTTVMIYDESCANERRRQRKRGKMPLAQEYVYINEDVCEACGDCGQKSNCMSLQQVPTDLGPKTQIHRSSCNQDYTCIAGECPSFVTVTTEAGTGYRQVEPAPVALDDLPAPDPVQPTGPYRLYMPGVGGTGVITLNAMLAFAAMFDGYDALTYDQTGAAQKWGSVLSSLTLVPEGAQAASNKVGAGQADLYLALDNLGAVSPANLDKCDNDRTAVLVNTDVFPTGAMIRDPSRQLPVDGISQLLTSRSRVMETVPARLIAEALFDDWMLTNVVALGAACQAGLLPITVESIEAAIELNGVAVERNRTAFRYGRMWVADPARVHRLVDPPERSPAEEHEHRRARLTATEAEGYDQLFSRAAHLPQSTRKLLAVRLARLIEYQDVAYASRYLGLVLRTHEAEEAAVGGDRHEVTDAVATYLYKVMAYKDEYEVARLLTLPKFEEDLASTFEAPVKVNYNLLPPAFRGLGRTGKVSLGRRGFRPALRLLARAKKLRSSGFDPFALQATRREEREILAWYVRTMRHAVKRLTPANHHLVAEIARLPDQIRGYEHVKSAGYQRAQQRAAQLEEQLDQQRLPLVS